jgi:WD40 repeat protein
MSAFSKFDFSADGEWLAVGSGLDSISLLPMHPNRNPEPRILDGLTLNRLAGRNFHFDPTGGVLVSGASGDKLYVIRTDGSESLKLEVFSEYGFITSAFSPSGRLVAVATAYGNIETKKLGIWDRETGTLRAYLLEPESAEDGQLSRSATGFENVVNSLAFADELNLFSSGADGVRRWNLETGSYESFVSARPGEQIWMVMSADRQKLVTLAGPWGPELTGTCAVVHDLGNATSQELDLPCDASSLAIGPHGEVLVTGCVDGPIHVTRIGEDSSHLLLGHEGRVRQLKVSPDGEWIASGAGASGADKTLRLWRMPDLSRPPLHSLPHDELMARLKSLTNLRAVRDPESSTGWTIEIGPFPGWAEAPEW